MAIFDHDAIRYARDWRFGKLATPPERDGYVEPVEWLAFLTPQDRAEYVDGMRENGWHLDILSEQEIAVALGVKDREGLWKYFLLDDPYFQQQLLQTRYLKVPGKSDPRAKAPN